MRVSRTLVEAGCRRPLQEAKKEKKESPAFPTGVGKAGARADLKEGPACGRAFRFVGESEDGYLAAAWDLALAS